MKWNYILWKIKKNTTKYGDNKITEGTRMIQTIVKRDGRCVLFDLDKIAAAIFKAAQALGGSDYEMARALAEQVAASLEEAGNQSPTVEEIQDAVERTLVDNGHARTAKEFILYRAQRTRVRDMNTRLMKTYEELTYKSADENDIKRENANIDGDTAMGTMLKYGSEGAKQFYHMFVLRPEHSKAHLAGDIHIHDLDFLTLTTTCCQIDIDKLFTGGFCTGHGFLREPNDISSYAALACIAIQSNQNDQHGGQSIPNFDYGMAKGVAKTYRKLYTRNLAKGLELARETGADLMLATDPDCDRVGIAVKEGEDYTLLTGNHVGALLFDYICRCRTENGTMPRDPVAVTTIVSTKLTQMIGKAYGVEVRSVLTGFKYIGEQIALLESAGHPERFLFGFEESYGYLSGTYVRDKDAVVGSMLIVEMASWYKQRGMSLVDALGDLYKRFGICRESVSNFQFEGAEGMKIMAGMMEKLREPARRDCRAEGHLRERLRALRFHLRREDRSDRPAEIERARIRARRRLHRHRAPLGHRAEDQALPVGRRQGHGRNRRARRRDGRGRQAHHGRLSGQNRENTQNPAVSVKNRLQSREMCGIVLMLHLWHLSPMSERGETNERGNPSQVCGYDDHLRLRRSDPYALDEGEHPR